MNIDLYILAFSAVTVLVTIWMGFRSAKKSKTASDFFVAGRSVGVGMNASAISGEYLSAASFMGIAGMVMSSGYDALWYPVCYACGYLFLLLFIAGPLRRFGAYTIPDFAEGRFDSPVFRKIAVVFVLFIGFFYTMPQMKGAGVTLAYIFPGLPYWAGVVLVGAVITLNVALGGMKGITLVQAFQYWAKMFAISVPIFVLMAVYGHYGKQLGVNSQTGGQTNSVYAERLKVAKHYKSAVPANQQTRDLARRVGLRRAAENALGIEDREVGAMANGKPEVVFALLSHLGGLGEIIVVDSWTNFPVKLPVPKVGSTVIVPRRTAFIAALDALEAAGACLIEAGDGYYVVARIKERAEYEQAMRALGWTATARAPLPAKAPADATWLNPFGPLTTKAAKNAGAAIGKKAAASAQLITTPDVNYLMVYENPKTNTPPPLWKPLVRDLLGHQNAAQLGIVVLDSVQMNPGRQNQNPVAVVLHFYGTLSHKSVFCDERMVNGMVPFPTNRLVGEDFLRTARAVLETNFLIVVSETESEIYFATTNYDGFVDAQTDSAIDELRRTGRVVPWGTINGGLIGNTMKRTPARKLPAVDSIPLRAGLSPGQRMTVNLDSLSVAQALGIYAELTGRQLLPNTRSLAERADDLLGHKLSQLKVITRPPAPDHGVREHGDGAFTASEVKEMVERDLLKRGWSLRPIGKTGFEAIASPTAVAKSGQKGPAEQSGARDRGAEHSGTQSLAPKSEVGSIYTPPPNGGSVAKASERLSRRPNGQFYVAGRLSAASDNDFVDGRPTLLAQGYSPSANRASSPTQNPPPATTVTPDPKAGIAAAAEKAWLAKHEKPLALLYTYSLIIAIVCGTAGLPHILVRFYTNPDGTAAKKTTMWVMILIGVFYVFPPVFGVLGRNLLPELYAGVGAKGTDKIVLELPRILNAKYPPLGSILSGITCAGAFAAFMSTFSGLLVSMTGALAHDVYGRILRPKSTPEQRMRMFKIGAVIIGAVAILLGMQVEQLQINFMVGQAFAIAAASYFPLLFMAVWWRKLTMKGAATGMLTGGTLALAGISLTSFSDLKWVNLADFWAMHPLLRILCEQPAIWAVPLAIVLMIVVSKLTAKTIPADSRMKMLVLHAPEQLGLKQEYIQEHQPH